MLKMILCFLLLASQMNCSEDGGEVEMEQEEPAEDEVINEFYFGADLSYVNQILDHGGVYLDSGEVENPYETFKEYGTDVVRLRLFHNPTWTLDVYDEPGTQMYNDLLDVEEAIEASKAQGMAVLLDFHYSDFWADPGRREIPEAWLEITNMNDLEDSVYNYTFETLSYLNDKGLMPEFVQIGNEINCGFFNTGNVPDEFPVIDNCGDLNEWGNLGRIINSGIEAVRDVEPDTDIILHIANPVNIEWWFGGLTSEGNVSDFDIIGFSYYPLWHNDIGIAQLDDAIAEMRQTFNREVMIMEVAYPWTIDGNDDYNNQFGGNEVSGYPITPEGQLDLMITITQNLIDGGGTGIFYWEPAWITSDLRDSWGAGSSWENNAFFDYDGNANQAFDYQMHEYSFDTE